jgi:energy-coupling factor transporter transmembrane protein EcfT
VNKKHGVELMNKLYKASKSSLYGYYIIAIIFILVLVGLIIFSSIKNQDYKELYNLILPVILFGLLYSGFLYSTHTIIIRNQHEIIFKSRHTEKAYEIQHLKSVKIRIGRGKYINFKFDKRNEDVFFDIDNFDDLMTDLKKINKNIETNYRKKKS